MPLVPWDMDDLIHNIEKMYGDLSDEILKDIARRINKMGYVTETAALQTQIMSESGQIYEDIVDRVSAMTGMSKTELRDAFKAAGVKAVKYDDAIYKAAGLDPIPLNLSHAMQNALVAGLEKTGGIMENLAKTMPNAGQKLYIDTVDRMYMQVSSGAYSYTEALRRNLKDMAAKGLTVVKYTGKTDKIDVAMRRALLTGVSQTANRVQIDHAYEMGSDLVEVSAHIGARPTHAVWQGQVYSLSGGTPGYKIFVTETHYGEGDGLGGWNCRHSFYPFFKDLSTRNYSNKELNDYDQMRLTYNGEEMSFYEGTQKQREIERDIRRWKTQAEVLGAGGSDNTYELAKVKEHQRVMQDFVKQTGLVRQPDREGFRVMRVVVPGYRPGKWVPGMGMSTPKPPKPPPPPAPPKPPTAWSLRKAEEKVINKYKGIPWNQLSPEEFNLYHAVESHHDNDPMNPNYYKLIYRLNNKGEIVGALSYFEVKGTNSYKVNFIGALEPGNGKKMLKEFLEKAMLDGKNIKTVKLTLKGLGFWTHFGFTIEPGDYVSMKFQQISARYINIWGKGEYENFKLINVGKFVAIPNPPPAPKVPKQLSPAQLLKKQKEDLFNALEAKELAGNLNDPGELVMYGALADEKAGIHKLLAKFDSFGDIETMVVYDDSKKQLTLVKIGGITPTKKQEALQDFFEKALLSHKGIDSQLRKAEQDMFKQLGIKFHAGGAFIIKPNEVKDVFIQAFGQPDFMRLKFLNPKWVELPTPKQKAAVVPAMKKGGKYVEAPQGAPPNADSCNNWVTLFPNDEPWIVSKDGKMRIEPSSNWQPQQGVNGQFPKVRVRIVGDGEGILKSDGPFPWGGGIKHGWAHREVAAGQLDEALRMGVVPKTIVFVDEDGKYRSLQLWIDNSQQGRNVAYDMDTFVKNMPDKEEPAKLTVIDMIIGNTDRHEENWIYDSSKHTYAIDNGLSFISTQDVASLRSYYISDLANEAENYDPLGNRRLLLNPKFKAELEKIIQNGKLEAMLKEGTWSDQSTTSTNAYNAALKRAKELVLDWDKYFYWPQPPVLPTP